MYIGTYDNTQNGQFSELAPFRLDLGLYCNNFAWLPRPTLDNTPLHSLTVSRDNCALQLTSTVAVEFPTGFSVLGNISV